MRSDFWKVWKMEQLRLAVEGHGSGYVGGAYDESE